MAKKENKFSQEVEQEWQEVMLMFEWAQKSKRNVVLATPLHNNFFPIKFSLKKKKFFLKKTENEQNFE